MNSTNKRKDTMEGNKTPKRVKKECSYGESCYRRNPAHFREFSHPHLERILDTRDGSGDYVIPESLSLNRHMIIEQLEVIIEKQLYEPTQDSNETKPHTTSKEPSTSKTPFNDTGTSVATTANNQPNVKTTENKQSNVKTTEKQQPNVKTTDNQLSNVKTTDNLQSNVKTPEKQQSNVETTENKQSNVKTTESLTVLNREKRKSPTERVRDRVSSSPLHRAALKREDTERKESQSASSIKPKPKGPDYVPVIPPARRAEEFLKVVRPRGNMAAKHAASAPYHIFYTTITDSKETHSQPYSITLLEILDSSLGELKCSLQINFMVELGWLLAQYYFAGYSQKKLTILYGDESEDLKTINKKKPHVDAHYVKMATPFGKHHTKMMILCYEDGSLRVVVSTANLYLDDWENRTQGLWMSPSCPELPPSAMPHEGDSPTEFKKYLLRYLGHYHMPQLSYYVERVKRCDFSHVNVFLVASAPGSHFDTEWGLTRAGALLRQHCCVAPEESRQWPLIAQASSLGSYGKEAKLWLTGDFLHHFTKIKNQSQLLSSPPELKLIYPSLENVQQSHDGLLGGGCLPYSGELHARQPWLNTYLHQWKATSSARDKAMPHIKSYTRVSKDTTRAAFYLLTSANVSKAAWGQVNKGNGALRLMSYEAGVLFLPRFVINENFFPLSPGHRNRLIIPYDLPPTKYTSDMTPWISDYLGF